jgi:hypothetical protein
MCSIEHTINWPRRSGLTSVLLIQKIRNKRKPLNEEFITKKKLV